jgi:hypothetical protein
MRSSVIMSLDHMDVLADVKIAELVEQNVKELGLRLAKGRRALISTKKKDYYVTTTGTLLYIVAILLSVIISILKGQTNF